MHIPYALEIPVVLGLMLISIVMPLALASCAIVWGVRAIWGLKAGIVAGWIVLVASPIVPIALINGAAADADAKFVGNEFIDNDGAERTVMALVILLLPALIANAIAVGLSIVSFNRRRTVMATA